MGRNMAVGQKVAEAAAAKVYDRYGDKIPIDLDPEQVADLVYNAIKKRQEKRQKNHRIGKAIFKAGVGAIAGVCIVGVVAALVVSEAQKLGK